MGEKVLQIRTKAGTDGLQETPLKRKRRKNYHHCNTVLIDEENRAVTCRKCGRVIDPFEFLIEQATKQEHLAFRVRGLQYEEKRLTESVTDLKREIRNAKARLSRAKRSKRG